MKNWPKADIFGVNDRAYRGPSAGVFRQGSIQNTPEAQLHSVCPAVAEANIRVLYKYTRCLRRFIWACAKSFRQHTLARQQ
jgi:hypothetical protein